MNNIVYGFNESLDSMYEHLYLKISEAIDDDIVSDLINECIYDVIIPLVIKIPFGDPLTLGQIDRVGMAAYVFFKQRRIEISSFKIIRIIEDLIESEGYIILRNRVKRSLVMIPQLRDYHHKFKINYSAGQFIVYY